MTSNGVSIIEPPYRDLVSLVGRLPPLGSVALTRIDVRQGLSPQFTDLLERAPWTVPCIVVAQAAVSAAVLQSIWSLPVQPAVLIPSDPTSRVTAAAAVTAAASRPRPTAAHLVAYVVRRTNSVVLGQTLDQIWNPRPVLGGANAARTVRYRLRRLGRYGSHDWIRIQRLVRLKTEGIGMTVEEQAHMLGTEARTLRSWVARYLGMTMKAFRATVGWEWVLELALCRGGVQIEDGPCLEGATTRREAASHHTAQRSDRR